MMSAYFDTKELEILVLEYEVLEEGVVKGGEGGEGLDELQGVLPLKRKTNICQIRDIQFIRIGSDRSKLSLRTLGDICTCVLDPVGSVFFGFLDPDYIVSGF